MLDDIRKYINERVKPVDFTHLLLEDEEGGVDDPPPADDGGFDDTPHDDGGFDDAGGGFDDDGGFDDAGGGEGGSSDEGSAEGGEEGEDADSGEEDKFKDREDDPDFTQGASGEGSPADGGPAGVAIYNVEEVLAALNGLISTGDTDLNELDNAKNVIELVANGKKLIDSDFEDVHDYDSFSEIIKKCLDGIDEKTKNYFNMKIKAALLEIQNKEKIELSKAKGSVDQIRDIVDKL